MRTGLIFAAVIAALTFGAADSASADMIDFEDISVVAGTNDIAGDRTSSGFDFDSNVNHSHRTNDSSFFGDTGSTFMVWDDFNGNNIITMDRTDSAAFSLSSALMAQNNGSTGVTVRWTGTLAAGGTIFQDFSLTGAYTTYSFVGVGWGNITSVTIDTVAGTGDNYYGVDDISVGAAVPEPTSLALLGLGLAGLGFASRRRKARAS